MRKLEAVETITAALEAAQATTGWAVASRMMDAVESLEKDQFATGADDGYNWASVAQVSHKSWLVAGSCGYGSRGDIMADDPGEGFFIRLVTCGGHSIEIRGSRGKVTEVVPDNKESFQSWGDEPRAEDYRDEFFDSPEEAEKAYRDALNFDRVEARRAEFMARLEGHILA